MSCGLLSPLRQQFYTKSVLFGPLFAFLVDSSLLGDTKSRLVACVADPPPQCQSGLGLVWFCPTVVGDDFQPPDIEDVPETSVSMKNTMPKR